MSDQQHIQQHDTPSRKSRGRKRRKRKSPSQQQQQRRQRQRERESLPGHPITLGGSTYYMTPPQREDMQAFEQFVREHRVSPLDIAKTKLDGLSPDQQRQLLRDALAQESSMPDAISETDFAAALDTRQGAALMFWIMLHKNHPDVKQEDVEAIIDNATDAEFQRLLDERDAMADDV